MTKEITTNIPLLKALFDHIAAKGLKRGDVWIKAGYSRQLATRTARAKLSPNLTTFINVCEAAGLEIKLVPKEVGRDLYREIASLFYNVPEWAVTEEQRRAIKKHGFGLMHNGGDSSYEATPEGISTRRAPGEHPSS